MPHNRNQGNYMTIHTIEIKADDIPEFLDILENEKDIWLENVIELNLKYESPDDCVGTVKYKYFCETP